MTSKLIEEKFPILEISKLAIPERSSYKPIYQISKWFARRSSSIFRAILLGSILPPSDDLMMNFYLDHDFSDITVLDPFMGGGTTIIEGLRLGLSCVGVDINPVAWFITKTEAEMVDLGELKNWIMDCEKRIKSKIKQWYLTECPICHHQADIIYTHWVKLVPCEKCKSQVPLFRNFIVTAKKGIATILCPSCEAIFEYSDSVKGVQSCPQCQFKFNPLKGNRIGRNDCSCAKCGNITNIIAFLKRNKNPLESKLFAIEGYCSTCANNNNELSPLKTTRFKFIKAVSKQDIDLFNKSKEQWKLYSAKIPWPKDLIPLGVATKTLHNHNYKKWSELFNSRQLMALTMILDYIHKIPERIYQEMFLAAFVNLLNHNNVFTRYSPKGQKVEGIFARHDFHPLSTFAENNVWGTKYGRGTWRKCVRQLLKGKEYNQAPYNYVRYESDGGITRKKKTFIGKINGKTISEYDVNFPSAKSNLLLLCQDAEDLKGIALSVDLIISDPPYADNVNYSELSDFFYVWLRLVLQSRYPWFSTNETPKDSEAIINPNRPLNYYEKLIEILKVTKGKLKSNGLLVFTFHHSEKQTWFKLAEVITQSGFRVVKTYAIPSEARNVLNIQKKKAIAFDLIIVCRFDIQIQRKIISLEKFKQLFLKFYKKRLELYNMADIKVMDYDHLAIYSGILLEMDSNYHVVSHSGHYLSQSEIWEYSYDLMTSSL
ncbi:MAG: hypothetical protein ACFE98_16995 [Candidatus Hermodarchaeota archaeon]